MFTRLVKAALTTDCLEVFGFVGTTLERKYAPARLWEAVKPPIDPLAADPINGKNFIESQGNQEIESCKHISCQPYGSVQVKRQKGRDARTTPEQR